jgi:heme A synthase
VSPYRLAAHLTSAFAIYSGLFWTALSVASPYPNISGEAGKAALKVRRFALPVAALVGITAISGAFVAGNDAVSSLLLISDAPLSITAFRGSDNFQDLRGTLQPVEHPMESFVLHSWKLYI